MLASPPLGGVILVAVALLVALPTPARGFAPGLAMLGQGKMVGSGLLRNPRTSVVFESSQGIIGARQNSGRIRQPLVVMAADKIENGLAAFLDASPTPYQMVAAASAQLRSEVHFMKCGGSGAPLIAD